MMNYPFAKQGIYNIQPATQEFEKDTILRALERCKGLRYAITSEKEDVALEAVNQSGMREEFINNHLEEIKTL